MWPMPTSARSRRRYHHGDLRAALTRAAASLLDERGVRGVTLREVARRAGVSHGAPYRHFTGREALLEALAWEGFARLASALDAAAPRGGREVARTYIRFALAQPDRFRLMYALAAESGREAAWRDALQDTMRAFAGAFSGLADARDTRRAAAAAWSLVHGLAQLMLDGHLGAASDGEGPDERFVDEVLGALRFSLRARPPRFVA
jgi:AcrR family transcriptional regulator